MRNSVLLLLAIGILMLISCSPTNGPENGDDTIDSLLSRYVSAVNSHDSAAIASCVDEEYMDDGMDKDSFMAMIAATFEEYPAFNMSVQKVSQEIQGDIATVVCDIECSMDGVTQDTYVDTSKCIRRSGRWYLYGDQKLLRANAFVVRFSNLEYYAEMFLYDRGHRATAVTLTGTGFTEPQQLTYGEYGGSRWWGPTVLLGSSTPPPLPATYTFEATTADSTFQLTAIANDYFSDFADPIYPVSTDTVDGDFSFVWHALVSADTIEYGIHLDGHFWLSSSEPDTTRVYSGPTLSPGYHYYDVMARKKGFSSHSLKSESFYVK